MAEDPELVFRMVPPGDEPAAALIAAMMAEMRALYHDLDIDEADLPTASPEDFVRFLVGEDAAGTAVCCGGLKPLGGDAAEIKRMYVVPAARRTGIGRRMLARLEAEARERGYAVVRLDTGPRQPTAERMYREAGYDEIGNFNANPIAGCFWGEKRLSNAR